MKQTLTIEVACAVHDACLAVCEPLECERCHRLVKRLIRMMIPFSSGEIEQYDLCRMCLVEAVERLDNHLSWCKEKHPELDKYDM